MIEGMRSRIGLLLLPLAVFVLAPVAAHAAIPYFGPIIPEGNLQICAIGWAGIILVLNNLISFFITFAILFIAPLFIGWGGFMYVMNPVSPEGRKKANTIMVNTLIGIVVSLSGYLLVDALLGVLYNGSAGGWATLIASGGQDPCIPLKSSLNQSSGATSAVGTSVATNSGLCAGFLVCGGSGKCEHDPQLDNGSGAAGQPCVAGSACNAGLSCDAADTCNAPGTTNTSGAALGATCVTSGGGSCAIKSDGACASSNMGVFGAAADQASQICNAESAGGALQQGDKIDSGPSAGSYVSFGLFQINITANDVNGLGCPHISDSKPGAFDSVFTGSHRNVVITNVSLYNQCKAAAMDAATNIATAHAIYVSKGDSWGPWSTHTKCGLAFLDSIPMFAYACEIISAYD